MMHFYKSVYPQNSNAIDEVYTLLFISKCNLFVTYSLLDASDLGKLISTQIASFLSIGWLRILERDVFVTLINIVGDPQISNAPNKFLIEDSW